MAKTSRVPPVKRAVRVWLAEHGKTQTWLASRIGVSDSVFSRVLSGKLPASLEVAVKIEDVTGIAAREFLRAA